MVLSRATLARVAGGLPVLGSVLHVAESRLVELEQQARELEVKDILEEMALEREELAA